MTPREKKQFTIALVWTLIAVLLGLYFYFQRKTRTRPQTAAQHVVRVPAGQVGGARVAEPTVAAPATTEVSPTKPPQFLITMNGLLIDSDSTEMFIRNVDILKRFLQLNTFSVILVFTVPSSLAPDVQQLIESLLESSGVFEAGLKRHRVVFTESVQGRISVGRQIQPEIFVESDSHVTEELTGKVPSVVCLDRDSWAPYMTSNFFNPQTPEMNSGGG